jgi:hypothetical protein
MFILTLQFGPLALCIFATFSAWQAGLASDFHAKQKSTCAPKSLDTLSMLFAKLKSRIFGGLTMKRPIRG